MAPEVLMGRPLTEKCDIYSYGIVVWELFTGLEPYAEHSQYKPFVKAVCQQNERPPIPSDLYPGLGKLLQETWQPDASQRPEMKSLIPRITAIMIDGIIPCITLSLIWRENWADQIEVPFSVFAAKLYETLNEPRIITSTEYRCLERVLAVKEDEGQVVKLDKLALVVAWFGPIYMPGQKPFLKRIEALLKQPWCFGPQERVECERGLKKGSTGDYLLRFSTTDPSKSPFTISSLAAPQKGSKKKTNEVIHCRVFYDDGGYHVFKPTPGKEKIYAPTLEGLLTAIGESKALGIKLKRVTPNVTRPYADLFTNLADNNGCYLPAGGNSEEDS
eukprot:TRINITY_DN2885_c0_g1_i6.p1 TRINITY_DN2885_c0_g1~~TRINITY_DN2885_c0_g1_i6.p1  ORF type:complete len:331 (+),score=41.96 TRINITY_DN2885_c0_g1_i6:435-1427(+)